MRVFVFVVMAVMVAIYFVVKYRVKLKRDAQRIEAETRQLKSSADRIFEGDYQKAKAAGSTLAHQARDRIHDA